MTTIQAPHPGSGYRHLPDDLHAREEPVIHERPERAHYDTLGLSTGILDTHAKDANLSALQRGQHQDLRGCRK